ncbi:MAG: hypothetical protein LBP59_02020 [Planctomycetaceae bacterium]|nr:hypothetical protein [Planctomycetaceae bacterium]
MRLYSTAKMEFLISTTVFVTASNSRRDACVPPLCPSKSPIRNLKICLKNDHFNNSPVKCKRK